MTARAIHLPLWPTLPPRLEALLTAIESEIEDGPRHPRPWNLAALPDELREMVWDWLPRAVEWINQSYAWQPDTVIPPCWREHSHLVLELVVLAFGHELAARSTDTRELTQWHDDLRALQERMAQALGPGLTECQRGSHAPRPSSYELDRYALHAK